MSYQLYLKTRKVTYFRRIKLERDREDAKGRNIDRKVENSDLLTTSLGRRETFSKYIDNKLVKELVLSLFEAL